MTTHEVDIGEVGMRNFETQHLWESMGDCPFCDAKASEFNVSITYSENLEGVLTHFMGECSECGAMGPVAPTERAAIRLWNYRPRAVGLPICPKDSA